jgi:hypothetical protein
MTLDIVDDFAYENGYWCEPNVIDINVIKLCVVVKIMLNLEKILKNQKYFYKLCVDEVFQCFH